MKRYQFRVTLFLMLGFSILTALLYTSFFIINDNFFKDKSTDQLLLIGESMNTHLSQTIKSDYDIASNYVNLYKDNQTPLEDMVLNKESLNLNGMTPDFFGLKTSSSVLINGETYLFTDVYDETTYFRMPVSIYPINTVVLRQENANIRVEYNLLNAFVNEDNFIINSTYQGPEPQTAVLGLDYFINRIDEVGFEVDFNQSASIGDYVFNVSYVQQVSVAGFNLTWNYQAYEDFTVHKLKSDDSLISNVTFISDTVYAGLNIIMDYEYISTTDYVAYLDNPASRTIVTLPSTGINYNAYDDYSAYYIIGQVQMSDLSFYSPTFYLPSGSIIRRITDIDNAASPELQSELLSTDFSPGDDESVFNFIQYRVYAEDYDQFDANYNTHYTDYFVAVQDITNNVYFDLTIRYDQNITNFNLEKVFVTFDLYQSGTKKSSMSLFSHFEGSNVGSNLQFRSSMSGSYRIIVDLPEGYSFIIQFESSSIVVQTDQFMIPSDIIPRKYSVTITIIKTNLTLAWGQEEIIDFNPTT